MDAFDEEVNELFRQWDEARRRVHVCKQLLRQCKDPNAGAPPDRTADELRTLQAWSDTSLDRLLEVMERRRSLHGRH
jgi:hypothetical protein